jgi:orotidine-5'-phosphate decarboxylase
MSEHFADRIAEAIRRKGSRVCVGLDPAAEGVARALGTGLDPADPQAAAQAIWEFNQRILDAVQPYCGVVKPQSAFYEVWGPAGVEALRKTIVRAREMGLICILDAKRNDIASTAAAYADAYLGEGPMAADALTVNPYLGADGIVPFVQVGRPRGRGIFVLVKTSNPSSVDVQDARLFTSLLVPGGKVVYERVAELVAEWGAESRGECGYSDVGAVVGATFPGELAALRERLPHTWLLVPGYGRQGGSAQAAALAFDADGLGAIVNSSSGIIFAGQQYPEVDFAVAAGESACEMRDDLEAALETRQR